MNHLAYVVCCMLCFVCCCRPFKYLTESQRRLVLEKAVVLKCTPGHVLLQEGQRNTVGVYIMLSGSVFMAEGSKKIAQGSLNGKRYVSRHYHH